MLPVGREVPLAGELLYCSAELVAGPDSFAIIGIPPADSSCPRLPLELPYPFHPSLASLVYCAGPEEWAAWGARALGRRRIGCGACALVGEVERSGG